MISTGTTGADGVVAFATFDSPDTLLARSNARTSKLYAVFGVRPVTV
jgi:hypothetical protein